VAVPSKTSAYKGYSLKKPYLRSEAAERAAERAAYANKDQSDALSVIFAARWYNFVVSFQVFV